MFARPGPARLDLPICGCVETKNSKMKLAAAMWQIKKITEYTRARVYGAVSNK